MNFQEITQYERKLFEDGIKYVAGIDEVGRGPLAGPFVVSAVILDLEKIFSNQFQNILNKKLSSEGVKTKNIEIEVNSREMNKKDNERERFKINDVGYIETQHKKIHLYTKIRDSKKVTEKRREILSEFIKAEAVAYSIEVFEPGEIDKLGISELTQKAFFQATQNLKTKPQYVLTDTFEIVKLTKDHQTNIVNGDNKSISIAAASIVAKVFRDEIMIKMHEKYPVYGFDRHKGYGTKFHIEALQKYGPCEIHRKSFDPVKSLLKSYYL